MEQKSQKAKITGEKETAILDSVSPKFNRNKIAYHETGDLFADTCEIVESAQSIAYAAVDTILVYFMF